MTRGECACLPWGRRLPWHCHSFMHACKISGLLSISGSKTYDHSLSTSSKPFSFHLTTTAGAMIHCHRHQKLSHSLVRTCLGKRAKPHASLLLVLVVVASSRLLVIYHVSCETKIIQTLITQHTYTYTHKDSLFLTTPTAPFFPTDSHIPPLPSASLLPPSTRPPSFKLSPAATTTTLPGPWA